MVRLQGYMDRMVCDTRKGVWHQGTSSINEGLYFEIL